jgi:hypothetical protein
MQNQWMREALNQIFGSKLFESTLALMRIRKKNENENENQNQKNKCTSYRVANELSSNKMDLVQVQFIKI